MWYRLGQKMPSTVPATDTGRGPSKVSCSHKNRRRLPADKCRLMWYLSTRWR